MAKGKTKFYAVAAGRKPGIYLTWPECERQVKGFSSARFKSFKTREEASAFVSGAAGTQTARVAAAVAPRSDASAVADRTSNPNAKQQSSSHAQKRPAESAPSAAKRPRVTVNDISQNNNGIVITVYFDGGARGNPGVAGAGAVITSQINGDDFSRVVKIRQYCGPSATNNVAEYTGLLLGLRTAKDFVEKYLRDLSKTNTGASTTAISLTSTAKIAPPIDIQINIRGDSDLIIKQMNGQYQCKNAKLIPFYDDCRSIASQITMMVFNSNCQVNDAGAKCRISIDMSHVYRDDNKVADALANEAMDERRSWRTDECVRHADGYEEELVEDNGKQTSDGNKKGAEVIELV